REGGRGAMQRQQALRLAVRADLLTGGRVAGHGHPTASTVPGRSRPTWTRGTWTRGTWTRGRWIPPGRLARVALIDPPPGAKSPPGARSRGRRIDRSRLPRSDVY